MFFRIDTLSCIETICMLILYEYIRASFSYIIISYNIVATYNGPVYQTEYPPYTQGM